MARGDGTRGEASALVRRFSENDPAILGYWLEIEPNGFDGRDAEFVRSWAAGEPTGEARDAFVAALDDPDPGVAKAARETIGRLKIDPEKFRAEAKAAKVGKS